MIRITQWSTMTREERQERLGDPSIERTVQSEAYDRACAERLQQGLPLSIDGRRKARAYLKSTTTRSK